jgi:hypothetical protein
VQVLQLLVQLPDLRPQGYLDQHADLSPLRHQLALKRGILSRVKRVSAATAARRRAG